ncbi:MAG: class I SAM-dependent methyltransferase [Betaproteobacteria bacterium]
MPDGHFLYPAPTFSRQAATWRSTPIDRWAVSRIHQHVASARLRFVLWDGFEIPSASGPPVAAIHFKNRSALYSWLWNPELYFGEAYMFGSVEVRGDLVDTLVEVYRALEDAGPSRPRWWRSNDISTSRANVHHHYDLGNDFYRLWLDRELLYTCAYFPTPAYGLEDAQRAKMNLVCRKLALQEGERVLEAGCGWGALALFMARHYGVSVTACNLSHEQIAYARERAAQEGLAGRVEFVEDDYRNMRGEHDVFVSVGMLEHVGLPDYPTFGNLIDRTIGRHGRGLLHFIGRDASLPLNPWIRRRIFPGAYPPTLREVFDRVLEPHTLSVLDVENLRLHYATTLDHWRRRYENAVDRIRSMFDEPFVRAWRLYLAGSQAAFTTGSLQLFQVVFARGGSNSIPWTRRSG